MEPQELLEGENEPDSTSARRSMRYWGKARPGIGATAAYHPLPFHCLDVAAVGQVYLDANPKLLGFFAGGLGLSSTQTREWLRFWLALHDLGKFAVTFQGQRPDLLLSLQQRQTTRAYTVRHDSLGAVLWQQCLLDREDVLSLGPDAGKRLNWFQPWVFAVTGHHGQPPDLARTNVGTHFDREDKEAAAEFTRAARALLLPQITLDAALALGPRLGQAGKRLSWWFAGVAVIADWLGSNTDFFEYRPEQIPLPDYWDYATATATEALKASGALPQPSGPAQGLASLFEWRNASAARSATPLQAWAEQVPLPDAPQLYLLEDVTGAGKTEAALMLAHRLIHAGRADGLYFGLPTMATSNAMFDRVRAIAGKLFAADASPSVVLAHGQRNQVAAFRDSVLPPDIPEDDRAQRGDETASARCAAWLADSTKKALLAQVGVGTIDQAQMAVLHARHQSLRLLGLFRKVLVVDEVHACDAYMLAILEHLLTFHAAAGGSAVLLSATLPQHMKQALADAFARGAGYADSPLLDEQAYPLAVRIADGPPMECPLDTRPDVRRHVAVDYIDDPDAVRARIRNALDQGLCTCWIRNTVADAIAAWERFSTELGTERVVLFHARFTMGDRLAIENRVQASFGDGSGPDERAGRLVIATQVVEQSLDVDFDLLVSDLAPIDRIIQRAGRLQRHPRDRSGRRIDGPDQRGGARLLVFAPAFDDTPKEDWYRRVFPNGAYVYPHVGQLWLTARCLQDGGFAMPEDGRRLIEGVFGKSAQAGIPEALAAASLAAEGKDWAETNLGRSNRLKLGMGYSRGEHGDWMPDADQSEIASFDDWAGDAGATRLGEPTTWVRLARWLDSSLVPWHPDGWEASGLRLPSRLIKEPDLPTREQSALQRVEESLPDRGRWSVLLPLARTPSGEWAADARDQKGRLRRWRYGSRSGFREFRSETVSSSETIPE